MIKELEKPWYDDQMQVDEDDDGEVKEYDITSIPNDFNILTLFNFIESGAVKIPGFQRNYVWDIKRASKLIESFILGLPVPQIFLYEESRNNFLVIDGQQRLMSIYFFIKQRFPRLEIRGDIKSALEQSTIIPDSVLADDKIFSNFNLHLPSQLPQSGNKFHGLNYARLGEYRSQFELRPIRNIIIKQNSPADDDSSIYEIFNRLNSGGVNLTPQEIRVSLYHSPFYSMLSRLNYDEKWRRILKNPKTDLHKKDIEILLRSFAMLISWETYTPSLTRFLNKFSKQTKNFQDDFNLYLDGLFQSFLQSCSNLPENTFISKETGRFNISVLEAVFVAACYEPFKQKELVKGYLDPQAISNLENDDDFSAAARFKSADTSNVKIRIKRALALIKAA